MQWVSLSTQYQRGMRRSKMAEETLSQAYQHVFMGNSTRAEAMMVLADLEKESGFVQVVMPGPGVSMDFENGKRYMFGRIFRYLAMTQEEQDALHKAARLEALTDAEEGPLI